jgi:hypothetical protein
MLLQGDVSERNTLALADTRPIPQARRVARRLREDSRAEAASMGSAKTLRSHGSGNHVNKLM